MKIGYVINEKYQEIQVLICSSAMDNKTRTIAADIAKLLEETLTLTRDGQTVKIPVDSIIRVYAQSQKVYAQTATDIWPLHMRLYEAEETLGSQFVRISNSEIVNRHKIHHLDATPAGTIKIYLAHDINSYVSRRYVSKIRKSLEL